MKNYIFWNKSFEKKKLENFLKIKAFKILNIVIIIFYYYFILIN